MEKVKKLKRIFTLWISGDSPFHGEEGLHVVAQALHLVRGLHDLLGLHQRWHPYVRSPGW